MKHQWTPLKCKMLCINIPQCHLQQSILPFHWVNPSIFHTCSLCGSWGLPQPWSHQTHLVWDPQPHSNQIGIIHNVPVGEGGSFGASCGPLEDTGHYNTTFSEDQLRGGSPGRLRGDLVLFFSLSDLGDCFYFFNSTKIAQFQLNRIHPALSHLHQPLTMGWTKRMEVGEMLEHSSHPTAEAWSLVSEGNMKQMWGVALHTSLPVSPGRKPTAGQGAGRAPTEVNWMLMGSLQDRVCCTALSCFTWLLSPACITSSMWKVPGSLESHMMTMDKSGSLAERKTPSTITERGEKCPDRLTLLRANLWASLTGSLQMKPPVAPPSAKPVLCSWGDTRQDMAVRSVQRHHMSLTHLLLFIPPGLDFSISGHDCFRIS